MTGPDQQNRLWAAPDWEQLPGDLAREDFSAWLVADEHSDAAVSGASAVTQLRGRVVDRVALPDAAERLARYAGRPIVVLDAGSGGDDATTFAHLSAIVTLAEAHGWPLVVTMPAARIDLVVSALDGRGAQLLCEPVAADWIGAIGVAASLRLPIPGPSDLTRESEAARLARLNQEVARIAEVLARLSDRGEGGARAAERRPAFEPEPQPAPISSTEVRDVIRARRLRDRFFPGQFFEDPAWDIMLDLFAARLERAQVSVSSLCIAAAVAPTTALRWIQKLSEAGLLDREPDPFDKRRAFMKLAPPAVAGITRYVAALREMRLPFV